MRPSKQTPIDCITTTIAQLKSCEDQLLKEKDLESRLVELEEKTKRIAKTIKVAEQAASESHAKVALLIGQEDRLRQNICSAQRIMSKLSDQINIAQGKLIETLDATGTKMLRDIPRIIEQGVSKDRRCMVQLVLVSQSDGILMGLPRYWTVTTPDGPVIVAPSTAVRPDMVVIVLKNNEQLVRNIAQPRA